VTKDVRREKMLDRLAKFFRRRAVPVEPFIDEVLGDFLFVRDIGWQKKVLLEGRLVNLHLGSCGENPSDEMRDTAKYWVNNWESRRHELNQYMESALRTWPEEELRFAPQELKIQSIYILWKDNPTACVIYFDLNDEDYRQFHMTFDGLTPTAFTYDD
jgi:hypothetical protein